MRSVLVLGGSILVSITDVITYRPSIDRRRMKLNHSNKFDISQYIAVLL